MRGTPDDSEEEGEDDEQAAERRHLEIAETRSMHAQSESTKTDVEVEVP